MHAATPELHVDSQLASQAVAAALPFTEVRPPLCVQLASRCSVHGIGRRAFCGIDPPCLALDCFWTSRSSGQCGTCFPCIFTVSLPRMQHMFAGALAGITEHIAMYPVDTIKTRMQALAHPGQQVLPTECRRAACHA